MGTAGVFVAAPALFVLRLDMTEHEALFVCTVCGHCKEVLHSAMSACMAQEIALEHFVKARYSHSPAVLLRLTQAAMAAHKAQVLLYKGFVQVCISIVPACKLELAKNKPKCHFSEARDTPVHLCCRRWCSQPAYPCRWTQMGCHLLQPTSRGCLQGLWTLACKLGTGLTGQCCS